MNRIQLLLPLLLMVFLSGSACRSVDRATEMCEQNNRMCHQNCNLANTSMSHSKMAHQSVSQCDLRCETNYQSCLKRAENRSVRVIDDTPEN
ncbi:MAG: hypothetical protein ACOY5B_07120 [Spirochaetota bacterium]